MNTLTCAKRIWILALLAVFLFISAAVLYTNEITLFKRTVKYKDSPNLVSDLRRLVVELSETKRSLLTSSVHYYRVGKHIDVLHNIIRALDEEKVIQENNSSASSSSDNSAPKNLEVCPEKFVGKDLNYGFPLYRKGFQRVNCTEFVPIHKLVTILVNLPEELLPSEQYQVFQGIMKYYPDITITMASKEKLSADIITKLKLKNIVVKDPVNGETWSKLLQEVTTPYVLFAPDITDFTDDVNLERLVRVLSENRGTIIAGGSHKNIQGHWNIGCLQLMFKNWTAYFRDGYYRSFADCIVCDVLSGPFLAKTKELKRVAIDERLPFGVFQDLFWRLKLKYPENVVVSCPDVMFNTYEREIPDQKYTHLVQKWDVKKWVDSNGRVRWYGCRRGYSHTNSSRSCIREKGLSVPPCDLENLADMIKFVMKKCEETGVYCEIKDGTLLGAVKFRKVLPWEDDADISILSNNFTAYAKLLRPKLLAAGFTVEENWKPICCKEGRLNNGSFSVKRDGWRIDMYGAYMLDSEVLVRSGQRPTRVQFAGQWVIAPRNPGLYARNHYGPNLYRHAEHWRAAGLGSPWAFYKPSSFTKCPIPGHSGCLDQFQAEGIEPVVYPLS